MSSSSSSTCLPRLRKEYKELQRNPVENIRAAPKESNILEWHYVIEGAKKSVYENGWYHGVVTFPSEYPFKPPSIQMYTPNGRFKPNTRLCLSMSDFHPETWNPMWSVGTILMGLYSFMQEETPTFGSITTSDAERRKFAKDSLYFNLKNKNFCELFPELVELAAQKRKEEALLLSAMTTADPTSKSSIAVVSVDDSLLAAIVAFTWAILTLAL
eukprot:gene30237-39448_t